MPGPDATPPSSISRSFDISEELPASDSLVPDARETEHPVDISSAQQRVDTPSQGRQTGSLSPLMCLDSVAQGSASSWGASDLSGISALRVAEMSSSTPHIMHPMSVEFLMKPMFPREQVFRSAGRLTLAQAAGSVSSRRCVVNLVTGGLGTGLLVLPWCTKGTTVLPMVVCIALVLMWNAWIASILIEASDRTKAYDYGSLLRLFPGRVGLWMEVSCNLLVFASTFMVLTSCFVVMADAAADMRAAIASEGMIKMKSGEMWLWRAAGVGWVTPLCFFDAKRLVYSSTLILISSFLTLCLLAVGLILQEVPNQFCYFGFGSSGIYSFGALVNTSAVQMCVLPMYGELERRSPQKMERITTSSFAILGVLYGCFACCGYMYLGDEVTRNLLNSQGLLLRGGQVARCLAIIATVGAYPIVAEPVTAPLRQSIRFKSYAGPAVLALILATAMCSHQIESLAPCCILNGFLCMGVFGCLIPAAVAHKILNKPQWKLAALFLSGGLVSFVGVMIVFLSDHKWDFRLSHRSRYCMLSSNMTAA